jgi:hypothetical protein
VALPVPTQSVRMAARTGLRRVAASTRHRKPVRPLALAGAAQRESAGRSLWVAAEQALWAAGAEQCRTEEPQVL